ncbi:hypothetical protein Bsp3421_001709 [Burkholderia sp. FERM BP-3421]|jgi:hypothetical protein|uniref:hypothetical protein n=1 Tax=Burkholderia sp. FERM BP-3421 TaxID=1494466 RepID=UPI00235E91C7|nr:hypothetical protein [Burkholderia sp. FERM BP-3421]WDD91762.1 hypothetical protein Bsp3421_001709 [Burkholderia sp. FERM BP-3421]
MKRILSILLAASLAGCFGISDRISTMRVFGGQPVEKASVQVRGGPVPTTRDVLAAQKPLRVSKIRNNSLICYDYLLSPREAGGQSNSSTKTQNFYVAFNLKNEVVDRGYMDCHTFEKNPNAHWWVE